MKRKYIFPILALFSIIIIGLYFVFRILYIPKGIDIDKTKYPITGIDISKHTGKVDFKKIKAQNIDFVFIKATEGESYVDGKFELNYKNAKKNNLPVGAYHFFRFNVDGKTQANNFSGIIKGKNFDLPLVIDIEEWGNATDKSTKDIVLEIASFLETLKRLTNKKIIVYTNENGYKRFIQNEFSKHDIWICSFNDPPAIKNKWLFWQHSHKGKLDGAEGHVDMNTFNGNKRHWEKFLSSGGKSSTQ